VPEFTSEPGSIVVDPRVVRLERLRNFSRLLDEAIAIPGTTYRIGLDPLLGLLPGGGDVVGLVLSCFIVFEAARMGVSKATLGRMAFNILLETLAGTVPVLGDVFDFAWKSNTKNIRLLEEHVRAPRIARTYNRRFAILLLVMLVLAIVGILVLTVLMLRWLVQAVQ
jgi:hypothetical protein